MIYAILNFYCPLERTLGGNVGKLSKKRSAASISKNVCSAPKKLKFSGKNCFEGLEEAVNEFFDDEMDGNLPEMIIHQTWMNLLTMRNWMKMKS